MAATSSPSPFADTVQSLFRPDDTRPPKATRDEKIQGHVRSTRRDIPCPPPSILRRRISRVVRRPYLASAVRGAMKYLCAHHILRAGIPRGVTCSGVLTCNVEGSLTKQSHNLFLPTLLLSVPKLSPHPLALCYVPLECTGTRTSPARLPKDRYTPPPRATRSRRGYVPRAEHSRPPPSAFPICTTPATDHLPGLGRTAHINSRTSHVPQACSLISQRQACPHTHYFSPVKPSLSV
jgi:hypothetical protein